jgi:3-oxoacyl-[acyl-carrier-protein] synthase-3
MNGIKIRGVGRSLPEKVVTNEDVAQRVDTSDEWIFSHTGIRRRRHCVEETHLSLCAAAARKALQRSGVDPDQIGACVVATATADNLFPSAACLLQRELGLSQSIPCFDLSAACTGFPYALHTMECLLASSERKYGLVVGGEVLSRLIDWSDRSTCILFGDGAGAVVVESRLDWPSIGAVLGAKGDDTLLRAAGAETGERSFLRMDGTKVFKFAVETVPACVEAVLQKTGLTVEDVDYFVFHQANARIIDLAAKKCHIPPEKYFKNIEEYGNTSAASIPIALDELWERGMAGPGSRVLLAGFGGGLTWGGAVIEFA